MSQASLNLRAEIESSPLFKGPRPDVGELHTAQTAKLAGDLSRLMWGADPEGRTTFVSDALLEAAGYEQDELTGGPLSRLLSVEHGGAENGDAGPNVFGRFIRDGQNRLPMNLRARDGSTYRIAWEPTARRDSSGRLVEVIGVARELLPLPEAEWARERQYELLDAARLCIIGMRIDGTILFLNSAAERLLGTTRDEMKGLNYFEVFVPHDGDERGDDGGGGRNDIGDHVTACLEARDYEATIVAKDGRRLTMLWSSAPVTPDAATPGSGLPTELFLFGVDITERRLREREDTVRNSIAALGSASLTFESYFNAVQHHAARLVAFEAAAFVRWDMPAGAAVPVIAGGAVGWPGADTLSAISETLADAVRTGRSSLPTSVEGAAGKGGPTACVVVPLITGGDVLGAFVAATVRPNGFSEREAAFLGEIGPYLAAAFNSHVLQAQRDEVRADKRLLLDQTRDGVLVLDGAMRCVEANTAACRMLGLVGRKHVGRPAAELLDPADPETARIRLAKLEAARVCSLGQFELVRQTSGSRVEVEAIGARAGDRGFYVLLSDVTERNRARRDSEETTRQDRWLIRSIDDPIALVRHGRIVHANTALVRLFGYKAAAQLEGQEIDVLYAGRFEGSGLGESERLQSDSQASPGDPHASRDSKKVLARKASGSVFPVEARTATFGIGERTTVFIFRDQTEREQLRRTLDRTRRIEGISELAGSVAHDFNGLLVTILGSTTLARSLQPGDPRHGALLGRMRDAASRAAELTSQLLAYSQGGQYVDEPVSLNQVAEDTLGMLKGCLPRGIRATADLMPGLPDVQGDPHQVAHVLLQAVLNAVEAMPNGGELRVATDQFEAGTEIDVNRPDVRPGAYARLVVSDSGAGMDHDVLRRVCEPFFTTKGPGRGLGMAAARGIVTRHNGFLSLSSSPGEGTAVEVLFPQAEMLLHRKEGT